MSAPLKAAIVPTKKFYTDLIKAIEVSLTSGLLAAQKALEYHRLKTYWQIGRDIQNAVVLSNGALRPGEDLYSLISRDIEKRTGLFLTIDTLSRVVQFHKNYPVFPEDSPLTFSHYLALQRISDAKIRAQMEKTAIKRNLSVQELKDEIARLSLEMGPGVVKPAKRLKVERGEPFVYYVRPETGLSDARTMRIDCGFKINWDIPPDNPYIPDQARVVRSEKKDGRYFLHTYREGKALLYTYPVNVLNVIDGDTVDVRIDVGFGIGLYDRLRLKGISAPELNTPEGRLAKSFLTDHLTKCPYVVLCTTRAEKFGRWLADIFAIPNCTNLHQIAAEGEYLNQMLIDKGFAEMYK